MGSSWVTVMAPNTYISPPRAHPSETSKILTVQTSSRRVSQFLKRQLPCVLPHRDRKVPWDAHVPARRNFWGCVRPATKARFGMARTHALLCGGKTTAPPVAPSRARREHLGICRRMEKHY